MTYGEFIESFEPLSVFIKFWIHNVQRQQYIRYVFEPECPIAPNEYNLFLGLKMNIQKHTELTYDIEHVRPFQFHVRTYFCRNDPACYNYFMNYFA